MLLALVIAAAVYDILYRRIPNWLTAAGVLTGFAMNGLLYHGWPGIHLSLFGFAIGFGVYLVLHLLHAMGAGDVKLMAAVGSMVGWQDWFGIFLVTAPIGGLMALILAVRRRRLRSTLWNVGFILSEMKSARPACLAKEELDVKSDKALRLPHGVVIAMGTIVFLILSAYMSRSG